MKLKRYFRTSIMVVALLISHISIAQQADEISREELIRSALKKSYRLANQQIEVEKAGLLKKRAQHAYLPKVSLLSGAGMVHMNMNLPKPETGFQMTPENIGALQQIFAPFLMSLNPEQQAAFKGFQQKIGEYGQMEEMNIKTTSPLVTAGITAYMPIFTGFKITNLKKAASHKEAAQTALLLKSEAEVIKEVSDYYDKLALLVQSQKVLEESRERLNKETQTAQAAFHEGLITSYDLSKIEIAKLELESKEVELEGKRELVLTKLFQLTGVEKEKLSTLSPVLEFWIARDDRADIENRPEALALDEAIAAREAKVKAARSGYLPTVAAFGNATYMKMGDVEAKPLALAGVALNWNIFDGMHTAHDVQEAKLEWKAEVNKKNEAMELLEINLQKTLTDYAVASRQHEVVVKQLKHAEKALHIATRQYEEGLIKITERLEAESDMQKAALEVLKAAYEQRQAGMRLLEATGELTLDNLQ